MKKIVSSIVFCSSLLSCIFAQPILDNSIFPAIGDAVDYISLSSGQGILPGNPGANVSWDFSNLNLNGSSSSISYVDPVATSSAGLFPEANMAKFYSIDQIEFYKKSVDSLSFQGKTVTGVGTQIYSNTRLDLMAPMNFGESFSDAFTSNFVNGSGVSVSRAGTVQTTYDGYGTLILPNLTIPNCIRIKTAKYTHDVTESTIDNYYDTLYYWYSPNIRDYLLYYYSSTISGSQYTYGYIRTNLSLNSVTEISAENNNFSIFPNQASEMITISLQNQDNAHKTCSLLDASGREIKKLILTGTETQVDISDLNPGIYFVKVGDWVEKLIVE